MANLALGPWIHVASEVAHFAIVRDGDEVEVRGRIERAYEKKGRLWADADVLVLAAGAPAARVAHTAILRLDVV